MRRYFLAAILLAVILASIHLRFGLKRSSMGLAGTTWDSLVPDTGLEDIRNDAKSDKDVPPLPDNVILHKNESNQNMKVSWRVNDRGIKNIRLGNAQPGLANLLDDDYKYCNRVEPWVVSNHFLETAVTRYRHTFHITPNS